MSLITLPSINNCWFKIYAKWLSLVSIALFFISSANAKTVTIAAGWARPPYIIPSNHSGFEIDLVRQVLKSLGHEINIVYVPYKLTIGMLNQGKADVALTLNSSSNIKLSQLSDVYVVYQNVALSLKSSSFEITKLEDLAKHSVVGFQSASEVLRKEFALAMASNDLYVEMADQRRQLELFLQGNTDVVVMDLNVFAFLGRELTGSEQLDKVNVHPFFSLSRYSAGFRDVTLKNDFNLALGRYVASGKYKKLREKYQIQQMTPILADAGRE